MIAPLDSNVFGHSLVRYEKNCDALAASCRDSTLWQNTGLPSAANSKGESQRFPPLPWMEHSVIVGGTP